MLVREEKLGIGMNFVNEFNDFFKICFFLVFSSFKNIGRNVRVFVYVCFRYF